MKKVITYLCLGLMLAVFSITAQAQQSPGSKIMDSFDYPELKWSVPEVGKDVQREVLDNGMILYMMEDHRFPVLNISALIRHIAFDASFFCVDFGKRRS